MVNLMTISDVFGLRNFYEPPKACATELGAISSVGRALRLHRRCREFESLITHHAKASVPQTRLSNAGPIRAVGCASGLTARFRSQLCRRNINTTPAQAQKPVSTAPQSVSAVTICQDQAFMIDMEVNS